MDDDLIIRSLESVQERKPTVSSIGVGAISKERERVQEVKNVKAQIIDGEISVSRGAEILGISLEEMRKMGPHQEVVGEQDTNRTVNVFLKIVSKSRENLERIEDLSVKMTSEEQAKFKGVVLAVDKIISKLSSVRIALRSIK